MSTTQTDQPLAIPAGDLLRLLDREATYQTLRTEVVQAESDRYLAVWNAFHATGRNPTAFLAETPASITRATLAAATRRHAPPDSWRQLMIEIEDTD
jgi:hypothetical protein